MKTQSSMQWNFCNESEETNGTKYSIDFSRNEGKKIWEWEKRRRNQKQGEKGKMS